MIAKMGNSFPICAQTYANAVAAALRTELGTSHRAIKTLRHWTDASERTAKHWLAGSHGPSGLHLIELMRHSDHALRQCLNWHSGTRPWQWSGFPLCASACLTSRK